MSLVEALYPICRSITGDGVRETLEIVGEWLPLEVTEVPSGTRAFDWTVPDEWSIREAWIEDMQGQRIVDFRESSLHVLNYSIPVDAEVDRATLDEHLYSIPEHPEWIPYRTTYYAEQWGFCVSHQLRESLTDSLYRVRIDADRFPGSLTYAECVVPGELDSEILVYTHTCHPSLCNDNLSGIAVAAAVGAHLLLREKPRYTVRMVFGPGTIGSIVWLSRNCERLDRIAHGLVIGLLGDDAPFTWKRSRPGTAEVDRAAAYVLGHRFADNRIVEFSPYGYDERQFGSPGINLPIGRLTRSVNGGYPEYHSSADNLDIISEQKLAEAVEVVTEIIRTLDMNQYFVNEVPYCEPQLGQRGLYRNTGGTGVPERESAMLWLLNQCDGHHSLLDVAERSGITFRSLAATAAELLEAGLLAERSGQLTE
jgi:aminopeptidase-like protein